MRPLLERMTPSVEAFFRADHALMEKPSPDRLKQAREVSAQYLETEHQVYQEMVDDGTWNQASCDAARGLVDGSAESYRAWLDSVEEQLKNPQAVVEAITSTSIVQPIAISPPTLPISVKTRDRTFF